MSEPEHRCFLCGKYFYRGWVLNNHPHYTANLCSEECCYRMKETTPDNVNKPEHYRNHPSGVECITVTEHMNFCVGNAMKYLWRADHKGGLEDLKKAAWYIRREIERRER